LLLYSFYSILFNLYTYSFLFSLHVNLFSCPFHFVFFFFIETKWRTAHGREVLTKSLEESMQRCIFLPVFQIQLFFIYSVHICYTNLQLCYFFPSILHIFLYIEFSLCQFYFLCCCIQISKFVLIFFFICSNVATFFDVHCILCVPSLKQEQSFGTRMDCNVPQQI
jgi:hypothetical protein